jgi:uncharacterized phiE125 gp8 family phage protein
MRKVLVTAATFKPLEVALVKRRPELRLTSSTSADEDLVIADMIESATEAYEEYTNNILCLSTWNLYLDVFPNEIEVPGPLSSVVSITYLDTDGVLQTLATTVYKVDTTSPLAGRITLKYGEEWESTYPEANAVIVQFIAGYANAGAIPQRIKDGLIAKIQELYYGGDLSVIYKNRWLANRRKPI